MNMELRWSPPAPRDASESQNYPELSYLLFLPYGSADIINILWIPSTLPRLAEEPVSSNSG